MKIDRFGIEFQYKGDTVIWTWPFGLDRLRYGPFISVAASGTGEFGDARFHSLKDLDSFWDSLSSAMVVKKHVTDEGPFPV